MSVDTDVNTDPSFRDDVPMVVQLADAQLRAYNACDIEAFCECFSEDVRVLDEDGHVSIEGLATFRERYGSLFDFADVRADVIGRLAMPPHLVEHEIYRRRKHEGDPMDSGVVLVRYTERDGKIAVVQFWHGQS